MKPGCYTGKRGAIARSTPVPLRGPRNPGRSRLGENHDPGLSYEGKKKELNRTRGHPRAGELRKTMELNASQSSGGCRHIGFFNCLKDRKIYCKSKIEEPRASPGDFTQKGKAVSVTGTGQRLRGGPTEHQERYVG